MEYIALQTLKIVYPQLIDVGCFSHTLDLVGEKFCIPCLSSFTVWWVSLFLIAHGLNYFGKENWQSIRKLFGHKMVEQVRGYETTHGTFCRHPTLFGNTH